jgi:hypothetical protein
MTEDPRRQATPGKLRRAQNTTKAANHGRDSQQMGMINRMNKADSNAGKRVQTSNKQARPTSSCGDSSRERDTPEKAGDPQLAVAEDGSHRPLAQKIDSPRMDLGTIKPVTPMPMLVLRKGTARWEASNS